VIALRNIFKMSLLGLVLY